MSTTEQIKIEFARLVRNSYLIEIRRDGVTTSVIGEGINRRIPIIPKSISKNKSSAGGIL